MEYKPEPEEVKHLRFLLFGSNGAGKSSFINSVGTTLRERMTIPAATNNSNEDESSYTVQYKTHRIRKGSPATYFNFVFNDIMGLESEINQGVRTEDIRLAMMGHIKDGYKFNPMASISETDPFYSTEPRTEDKVHVLVCVINVNCGGMDPLVTQKIKEVRQAARDLGIPDIAIATHIDELCEETEKDLHNVYKSKVLKKKMSEISAEVGVDLRCFMAVQNYCKGKTDSDPKTDTLILTVLRHMVHFGNDFLDEAATNAQ